MISTPILAAIVAVALVFMWTMLLAALVFRKMPFRLWLREAGAGMVFSIGGIGFVILRALL